ncbi:hypothetical protein CCACVL1_16183, partial [Corchorus capsularis]
PRAAPPSPLLNPKRDKAPPLESNFFPSRESHVTAPLSSQAQKQRETSYLSPPLLYPR